MWKIEEEGRPTGTSNKYTKTFDVGKLGELSRGVIGYLENFRRAVAADNVFIRGHWHQNLINIYRGFFVY